MIVLLTNIINFIYSITLGYFSQRITYIFTRKLQYYLPAKLQLYSATLTGLLYGCLWLIYGYSVEFILLSLTCTILVNISFVDSLFLEIPDEHNLALSVIGISYIFMCSQNPVDAVLGFLAGGLLYLLMAIISGGGIGGGDIKLAAATGLILGLHNTLLSILYAFMLAFTGFVHNLFLAFQSKKKHNEFKMAQEMAFGPYIVTSILMILLGLA